MKTFGHTELKSKLKNQTIIIHICYQDIPLQFISAEDRAIPLKKPASAKAMSASSAKKILVEFPNELINPALLNSSKQRLMSISSPRANRISLSTFRINPLMLLLPYAIGKKPFLSFPCLRLTVRTAACQNHHVQIQWNPFGIANSAIKLA